MKTFKASIDIKFENFQMEIKKNQKEQFSDGVGYGWIDYIKEKTKVYHSIMDRANEFFPIHTPTSAEAFHYRLIFEDLL